MDMICRWLSIIVRGVDFVPAAVHTRNEYQIDDCLKRC